VSWETEFDELLTETVTRQPYTGQDKYGQATFGSAENVQCRIVQRPEIVRQAGGESTGVMREVVAKARIYCRAVPGWGLRDRVTLPDGSQPVILEVHTYPDEDGEHHQVVVV
jgi:hypothetical protein